MSVGAVFLDLFHHPFEYLFRRWNWKSALTSSLLRGGIFFGANLKAGFPAAFATLLAEFAFRTLTSGFYGSLTQAFRRAEPVWLATLCVMVFLPFFSHVLEFLVHWLRGTPELKRSIVVSVSFTVISTLFNFYAMRHGVLLVGEGRQSLWQDMRQMPQIVGKFLLVVPARLWRLLHTGARAER